MEPIEELIRKSLTKAGLKKPLLQWDVIRIWPEVVGESIAKVTQPYAVVDGILLVNTSSSSWANELSFYKMDIKKQLEEALGKNLIRDIRFSEAHWKNEKKEAAKNIERKNLTRAQEQAIQQLSGNIEDPALQKQFKHLVRKGLSRK